MNAEQSAALVTAAEVANLAQRISDEANALIKHIQHNPRTKAGGALSLTRHDLRQILERLQGI